MLNKVNSLLFVTIPFLRLTSIFYVFSGVGYKDYVLIFSLALFLPELLFLFYDNSLKIKKNLIISLINYIGYFFIIFWLIALYVLNNNIIIIENSYLIFLIIYTLHDAILLATTPGRTDNINLLFNLTRFLAIVFIVVSLPELLIISLALSHYLFNFDKNKYIFSKDDISKDDLSFGVILVTFSTLRTFITLKILQTFLNGDMFFIVNIFSRAIIWVVNLIYTVTRNLKEKINLIDKYYVRFKSTVISAMLIYLFINISILIYDDESLNNLYIFGLLFYVFLALETYFCQLTILFRKGNIKLIAFVNFLAFSILLFTYEYLITNALFVFMIMIFSTLINSLIFYRKWSDRFKEKI
tara:strand:- start:705 stop:1769 length:1065 start_codon:yes stop_codon:yes gene_type:complete